MIQKELPIAGEVFSVNEHTAFVIASANASDGNTPWVWYAPTLPGLPGVEERWMFQQFIDAGIAIAGIDVGESFGSPDGRIIFTAFYNEMVKRGMSAKPCLLARSRGGLMLYNWAVEHPESVSAIAGIYPVCNLHSYPEIKNACAAYGMTEEELIFHIKQHNPINRIKSLADNSVPIFHIHGDCDIVVPVEDNSGELAKRYHEYGGNMTLKIVEGQGHNMWSGWFECRELVEFVIASKGKV